MPQVYKPSNTHVSDDAIADFLRCSITGRLTEVPGIGVRTAAILYKADVRTTFHLIGRFLLMHQPDDSHKSLCDKFLNWLIHVEIPPKHRHTITRVIAEKIAVSFPQLFDVQDIAPIPE